MSRNAYLILALIGTIAPYYFFVQFLAVNPATAFVPALFVNGAASGFSADLLISSFVFWGWMFSEQGRNGGPRPWLYILLNLVIGLSCALPLYLWSRGRSQVNATP